MLGGVKNVTTRLRKAKACTQCVTLKVRTSSFSTTTRNRTLATPVDDATTIYETARTLLDGLHIQRAAIRLLGISLSHLHPAEVARQLSLDGNDKWQDIDRVVDGMRQKYQPSILTRGILLDPHLALPLVKTLPIPLTFTQHKCNTPPDQRH